MLVKMLKNTQGLKLPNLFTTPYPRLFGKNNNGCKVLNCPRTL